MWITLTFPFLCCHSGKIIRDRRNVYPEPIRHSYLIASSHGLAIICICFPKQGIVSRSLSRVSTKYLPQPSTSKRSKSTPPAFLHNRHLPNRRTNDAIYSWPPRGKPSESDLHQWTDQPRPRNASDPSRGALVWDSILMREPRLDVSTVEVPGACLLARGERWRNPALVMEQWRRGEVASWNWDGFMKMWNFMIQVRDSSGMDTGTKYLVNAWTTQMGVNSLMRLNQGWRGPILVRCRWKIKRRESLAGDELLYPGMIYSKLLPRLGRNRYKPPSVSHNKLERYLP